MNIDFKHPTEKNPQNKIQTTQAPNFFLLGQGLWGLLWLGEAANPMGTGKESCWHIKL